MQALCDRTLSVVRSLLARGCAHKLRCVLSKADTVPSDADRNKVLVQLTQTLTSRTGISLRDGIPTLYIPPSADTGTPRTPGPPGAPGGQEAWLPRRHDNYDHNQNIPNYIFELCAEFEQAIEQTVESTLDRAKCDAAALLDAALARLATAAAARASNRARAVGAARLLAASALPPLLLCLHTLAQLGWFGERTYSLRGNLAFAGVHPGPSANGAQLHGALCALGFVALASLHLSARWAWRSRDLPAELAPAAIVRLEQTVDWVRDELSPELDALYDEYFAQSVDLPC